MPVSIISCIMNIYFRNDLYKRTLIRMHYFELVKYPEDIFERCYKYKAHQGLLISYANNYPRMWNLLLLSVKHFYSM